LPNVLPAPAEFSTQRRVPAGTERSACAIAFATRLAPASGPSARAVEPGWKHTPPTPSAVERSISLAKAAAERAHLSGSSVATFSTYAPCTMTCSAGMPVSASARRKRSTRSGRMVALSP
jgi:hypothetical protein